MLVDFVNKILSLGTVLSQIFIAGAILYSIFFRRRQNPISQFLGRYGLVLAFIVALVSMGASLYYSQIVGFPPCELCWFQRIFMYPLVFLLGLALLKKPIDGDFHIIDYALLLSIVGGIISLYHNYMYYYNEGLNAICQLSGMQVSCIKRYVFEFGYVTIPLMALTAFVLIIIFLLFKKHYRNP